MMEARGFPDLLPIPRRVERHDGRYRLNGRGEWRLESADARLEDALQSLRARLPVSTSLSPTAVRLAVDASADLPSEGYLLLVQSERVTLVGRTEAACFYGLQTLTQLIDPATGEVPRCTIVDWPDFATRGLLLDVTRGKVPTLSTLKQLVDRLAALKVNQLQLYIEHAFVFSFNPDICSPDEGLTPDEVRALDGYCRERFIDLVPALANLGHMGRILAMPRYRHLAEIEAPIAWEDMPWPQRLRGLTLDAVNPEARQLVEKLWTDILDAFSSPVVNICGDEPWDLGEGKNRDHVARMGKADLYLGHLRRVQELCASHGRTTQFWGDVVRHYPQQLHRLRERGTILHWGYDDRSDYAGTENFVATGLPTVVCTGTSGWKRTLNAIGLAERNIQTFAQVGKRHGATGLLNTDWGDHGHFNTLAASGHGIAFGACCGWRADHDAGAGFDRLFLRWVWEVEDKAFGPLLRDAARVGDHCETWRMLWMPADDVMRDPMWLSLERAHAAQSAALAFLTAVQRESTAARPVEHRQEIDHDLAELAVAAELTALATEKMGLLREHADETIGRDGLGRRCRSWADRLNEAGRRYGDCWARRNKPLRLADIQTALSSAASDSPGGPSSRRLE